MHLVDVVLLANYIPIHQVIPSLVCCNAKTDHNPDLELAAAKKGLTDEIQSVSRVQIRTSTTPQDAYANGPGASLLQSFHDRFEKLEQQGMEQREKVAVLEKEGVTLKEKITVLWYLKDSAVAIRKRFFATYDRKQDQVQNSKDPAIGQGNKVAHDGDVITDVCLIENDLMDYKDTFTALYGLDWESAKELSGMQIYFYPSHLPTALSNIIPLVYPHIIEVMNIRATELTNSVSGWTPEIEAEFCALIGWTRWAIEGDPQELAKGFIGKSYGKGLDKLLKRKI